jgi:hypothetical protein
MISRRLLILVLILLQISPSMGFWAPPKVYYNYSILHLSVPFVMIGHFSGCLVFLLFNEYRDNFCFYLAHVNHLKRTPVKR